jgi:hypothetical protein
LPELIRVLRSALERRIRVPFGAGHVYVMSKEDVLLTKLIFARDKDFVDIARLLAEPGAFDEPYLQRWITELFRPDDPRLLRFNALRR